MVKKGDVIFFQPRVLQTRFGAWALTASIERDTLQPGAVVFLSSLAKPAAAAPNRTAETRAPRSVSHGRLRGCGSYAPDHVADIVGDQQAAGPVDRDADRTAECLPIRVEAGEDIDRLSGRAPGGERHEDDLIAAARLAIP